MNKSIKITGYQQQLIIIVLNVPTIIENNFDIISFKLIII